MKKIICLIALVLASVSCSSNDERVSGMVNDKIETMTGQEIVLDLLIENEGDEEQLARIFKCSVSTINRVKNKETYLTDNATTEFKNFLTAVKVSGKETFKENDPYYDFWIRSFRSWLDGIFWIVLTISIFGAILGFITGSLGNAEGVGLLPLVLYGFLYLIIWILGLIWSYENPTNLFLEKINPLFETLM